MSFFRAVIYLLIRSKIYQYIAYLNIPGVISHSNRTLVPIIPG